MKIKSEHYSPENLIAFTDKTCLKLTEGFKKDVTRLADCFGRYAEILEEAAKKQNARHQLQIPTRQV